VELAVGVRGVQADGALAAGERALPRRLVGVELVGGATEQQPHKRERLLGGLGRAAVAAAGVIDKPRLAAVVDLDDEQLGGHREGRRVPSAGLCRDLADVDVDHRVRVPASGRNRQAVATGKRSQPASAC
jgi:hypothetical protein